LNGSEKPTLEETEKALVRFIKGEKKRMREGGEFYAY